MAWAMRPLGTEAEGQAGGGGEHHRGGAPAGWAGKPRLALWGACGAGRQAGREQVEPATPPPSCAPKGLGRQRGGSEAGGRSTGAGPQCGAAQPGPAGMGAVWLGHRGGAGGCMRGTQCAVRDQREAHAETKGGDKWSRDWLQAVWPQPRNPSRLPARLEAGRCSRKAAAHTVAGASVTRQRIRSCEWSCGPRGGAP
jgi:hypothetical protein